MIKSNASRPNKIENQRVVFKTSCQCAFLFKIRCGLFVGHKLRRFRVNLNALPLFAGVSAVSPQSRLSLFGKNIKTQE